MVEVEKLRDVVTTEAAVTGGNEKEVGTLARIDFSCDRSGTVVQ